MSYNLFLDDVRSPNDSWMSYVKELRYPLFDWVVVRNFEEFKQEIDERGIPAFVSYDHDLSEEHYSPSMYGGLETYEEEIKGSPGTGLDCAKYLISKLDRALHPPYIIHSQNPVGKIRIKNCILDYHRYLDL